MKRVDVWFGWVTLLGFVVTNYFAIPGILYPEYVVAQLHAVAPTEPIWPAFAFLLTVLVSLFYIPAAVAPTRYLVVARLSILARYAGACFWFWGYSQFEPAAATMLGWVDLCFGVLQTALLAFMRDQEPRPKLAAAPIVTLGILAMVVLGIAYFGYDKLFRRVVPVHYDTENLTEVFLYGSIGAEEAEGIPYLIWEVLPRVFPEYLPGGNGYGSLGIVQEPGAAMPVGFTRERIGFDRVAINCATCHVSTYQEANGSGMHTVPGGDSARFDAQRYVHFLARSAADIRFTDGTLVAAVEALASENEINFSWIDRALYQHFLIPATAAAILEDAPSMQSPPATGDKYGWMRNRPSWGPGRVDPFNPPKIGMLELPVDDTIGNSDIMPLWQIETMRRSSRGQYHLHWDGLSTDPVDASLSGALGDGARPDSLRVRRIRALVGWMDQRRPPAYPRSVDAELARRGRGVYAVACALCHDLGQDITNTVVRLKAARPGDGLTLSTDANRLRMWNPKPPDDPQHPAKIYNKFADGYEWDLNTFVATEGYVSVPLTGVWLTSPYLHNGSVPTLEDLLELPMSPDDVRKALDGVEQGLYEELQGLLSRADRLLSPSPQDRIRLVALRSLVDRVLAEARAGRRRPPLFYRGSDMLDETRIGFVHDSRAATGDIPIPYATFITGNSHSGHMWGTDLSDEDKRALVEFLKTK